MNVLRLKETMLMNKVEFLEKNCVFLSYTENLLNDVLRLVKILITTDDTGEFGS